MLPLQYEGDLYRPPSEAHSLIFQATIGCSHNRCTFCSIYKRKTFREKSLADLQCEIITASKYAPHTKRIFLADGNALTIATEKLLNILKLLRDHFPLLERVSLYGNPQDLQVKSINDLKELKNNKLKMIYLGVESGSTKVLQNIKKDATPEEIIQGSRKVKDAGILLSVTAINGLAGREESQEHALATARMLNDIDPDYVGLLSLMPVPGTTIYRNIQQGLLTPLSPWHMLEEIKTIVEHLVLTDSIFRANHASNYLPLKANLSRDKKLLLSLLEKVLIEKDSDSLKNELLRGL